jgi:tripartite-type tricarboxylate transporter receptor subunit TctC
MVPKRKSTARALVAAAACFSVLRADAATAQDAAYPTHAVTLIVPFAPGGGNDFIARFIAQRLGTALGQPVVVENKPGAGGELGVRLGVQAKADGYTLTLISNSYTVNPSLYKLPFDPVTDISPIVQIAQGPFVVVSNPDLPVHNIGELIALAKSKPGMINYASSGQGSIPHLATELFASMAGIKMTHVPYRGGGPALTDTLAGQTSVFLSPTSTAIPLVKSGKLRALAVTTAMRSPALPDVPSVAESGVPGYDVVLWHGLIGPKGLPPAVVARLNREINTILQLEDAVAVLNNDGVASAGGTPQRLQSLITKEIATWHKVAEQAGIKPRVGGRTQSELFIVAKVAPLPDGQCAQRHASAAHALQARDREPHQLAHPANLPLASFAQHEAELMLVLP